MLNSRVVVTKYGGPEVLEVIQEPLRKPKRGEVLVRVKSSGVALADIMRRTGKSPLSPTPPFTPGYDAVGVVVDVGGDVTEYSEGDRVAVFFNGTGGYATFVYATLDEVVPVSSHIDEGTMVAAILNYVTAYQMLHRIAKVSKGERILIHGASGGTGTALLDIGKLLKLEMYGTATSSKHSVVTQFGATPIDYKREDFVQFLHQTVPKGVDAVFDPIGGANYERSLQTLNPRGRFVGYGYTSILKQGEPEDWVRAWGTMSETRTTGSGNSVYLYSITSLKKERLDWFREDVRFIVSLLESGQITPVISHRVPLAEVARAHELLENSLAVGKVVLIHE